MPKPSKLPPEQTFITPIFKSFSFVAYGGENVYAVSKSDIFKIALEIILNQLIILYDLSMIVSFQI